MGKKGDLSDLNQTVSDGLSISKTADLQGFSCITISKIYREWSETEKNESGEQQFC